MALLLRCLQELRVRQGESIGFALDLTPRQSAWVADDACTDAINAAQGTSMLSFNESAVRSAAVDELRHEISNWQ